jgi:ABC-2 type transport system permease protein
VKTEFIKYFSILKYGFLSLRAYRMNYIGWFFLIPIQMVLMYYLWQTVFAFKINTMGFSFQEIIIYYLLISIINQIINVAGVNFTVWNDIHQGKIEIYLTKPIHYKWLLFVQCIPKAFMNMVICTSFYVVLSFIFGFSSTIRLLNLVYFTLSVSLSFIIYFNIQFIIGSYTFWTEKIFGMRDITFSLFMIFSGMMIPLNFFPNSIRIISKFLPFEYIFYFPAQMMLNKILPFEILRGFEFQMMWLIIVFFVSELVWNRGLNRIQSARG